MNVGFAFFCGEYVMPLNLNILSVLAVSVNSLGEDAKNPVRTFVYSELSSKAFKLVNLNEVSKMAKAFRRGIALDINLKLLSYRFCPALLCGK